MRVAGATKIVEMNQVSWVKRRSIASNVDGFETRFEVAVQILKPLVYRFESLVNSGETFFRQLALSFELFFETGEVLEDGQTVVLLLATGSVTSQVDVKLLLEDFFDNLFDLVLV